MNFPQQQNKQVSNKVWPRKEEAKKTNWKEPRCDHTNTNAPDHIIGAQFVREQKRDKKEEGAQFKKKVHHDVQSTYISSI